MTPINRHYNTEQLHRTSLIISTFSIENVLNVHETKFTMPAGLSGNLQEETSSGGDVVRHLLCQRCKDLMCGSSSSSNTDMLQWKRAHLLNMPLLP